MKNLLLAALVAAQIMDKLAVYCSTQSEITWGLFTVFYLALLLLRQWDRYTVRQKRMHEHVKQIERAKERKRVWECLMN